MTFSSAVSVAGSNLPVQVGDVDPERLEGLSDRSFLRRLTSDTL